MLIFFNIFDVDILKYFRCCFRYDYVVVGHFLPWKRSWTILQKGGRRLAIGEVYDHIEASLQMVAHFAQEGVTVSAMVPAHELADIYRLIMSVALIMM
jgi:hypothetical protein